MHKSPISLIAIIFLLSAFAVQAQQKKPSPTPTPAIDTDDVVRISTDLVQTDVTVFDKQGKFVNDLKLEDFQLLIDGQPQPISFFESVVTGARSERAALRAARDNKPPPPVAESETDRGRTILFFVDDLHLDPGSLARTHKTLNSYIENMLGPNDQVAITSASGQIGFLQQLTNNRAVLRAALDRLKAVPGATRDLERPNISEYAAFQVKERNDRALFDYLVDQTMKANRMNEQQREMAVMMVTQRVETLLRNGGVSMKQSFATLVNLLNSIGKLSGRKLLFFFSDGFVPNFVGSDFTTMHGRVTHAAARGGVVIYTLDARGLSTDSAFDAGNGGSDPFGVAQSRLSGERAFTQEPLHALAADTGGRALLNSNDLEAGVARALDETSRYYLLAWRPGSDAQRASNFSKIKITVANHPDLKVQLRRGYLGAPPERPKNQPTTVELEKTDDLGVTESSTEELRTAVSVGYKQTSSGSTQISSSVQVNAQSADEGSGRLDVNVLGAVFDSKGKAVGSFKQRVEVIKTPASKPVVYATVNHQTVDVPPGLYQVRVFSYERGTTKLSNAMEWIEVPKLKAGAFSISSLYVGEIAEAAGSSQVTVNANRRFARSSRMRFTTYIYNASHGAAPPQLGVQLKILKGEQAVITPPEAKISTEKLTNFANITYTGEYPLSSLPPGSYVMEVKIIDKGANASAAQQLRFTVY